MNYKKRIISTLLAGTLLFSTSCNENDTNDLNIENNSENPSNSSEILDEIDKKYEETEKAILNDLNNFKNILTDKFETFKNNPESLEKLKKETELKLKDLKNFISSKYNYYKNQSNLNLPHAENFIVKSYNNYNVKDLYIINASLLNDSLGTYITSYTLNVSEDGNSLYNSYPSINEDFVLIHKITFENNTYKSSVFYTNKEGVLQVDTSDMNAVISDVLIDPLSDYSITTSETITKEEINYLLNNLNNQNNLTIK